MNPDRTAWPNLYLVGFMGTGKSTVGQYVAKEIGLRFVDVDNEIEQQSGTSILKIFAEEGEAAFRKMERIFIEKGHPDKNCVVACGGGLVVQPGMLEMLKQRGIIISLHSSPEQILERTRSNMKRPLLNVRNPRKRIQELLNERESIYRQAGPYIMNQGRSVEEVAADVQKAFKREVMQFHCNPQNARQSLEQRQKGRTT